MSTTSVSTNLIDIARTHYDNIKRGDLDASAALFAADVETISPGGTLHGFAEFRGFGEAFRAAMSEVEHEIVRHWEAGDTLVLEGVFSGVHTGAFVTPEGSIPATGNRVSFTYADFMQVADGKVVSHRMYWDNLSLMAQLGAAG